MRTGFNSQRLPVYLGRLKPVIKWPVFLLLFIGYWALYIHLHAWVNSPFRLFALIYIVAAVLFWGLKAGIGVTLLGLAMGIAIHHVKGVEYITGVNAVIFGLLIAGMLGWLRDLSLRLDEELEHSKAAEEALRNSESRLADIAEAMPGAIFQLERDEEGTLSINFLKGLVFETTGMGEQDLISDFARLADLIPAEDLEAILVEAEASAQTMDFLSAEFRLKSGDNHRWMLADAKPSRQDKGRIVWNGVIMQISRIKQAEAEREKLIDELQAAVNEIKALQGMLPICVSCKKIRDDDGFWQQIELYIEQRSDVLFSHGLCPDCAKKLYPEYSDKIK